VTWRAWVAYASLGCAVALAFGRGDWAAAGGVAAAVLLPVAWRVRGELLAAREMLRAQPVPGKHRRSGRPRELPGVVTGRG